jgi:hypothetical protein
MRSSRLRAAAISTRSWRYWIPTWWHDQMAGKSVVHFRSFAVERAKWRGLRSPLQPLAVKRPALVNGAAGVVVVTNGRPFAVMGFTVAQAREALQKTTDAHLETSRRLLASGQLAFEQPRHQVLRDTFLHSAHHRGQMTVYLRLLGSKVPSVYGPTADDRSFG